jgi:hypothetical protein
VFGVLWHLLLLSWTSAMAMAPQGDFALGFFTGRPRKQKNQKKHHSQFFANNERTVSSEKKSSARMSKSG